MKGKKLEVEHLNVLVVKFYAFAERGRASVEKEGKTSTHQKKNRGEE